MLGSKKEFVIIEAQTHGPGYGTAYQCSEPSVIPLSYSGAERTTKIENGFDGWRNHYKTSKII